METPSNKTGCHGIGARGILSAVLIVVAVVIAQAPARGEVQDRCESVDSGPDLSGVWRLSVEDLDIWAPRYTLVKATGRIRWKLSADGGDLSLLEYDPGAESPAGRPADVPAGELFEEVEIREVIVRDDLIAFKVEGVSGAYEAYWLEHFSEDEIVGTYTVYDRYGGGPGSGPEYRARLILKRVVNGA